MIKKLYIKYNLYKFNKYLNNNNFNSSISYFSDFRIIYKNGSNYITIEEYDNGYVLYTNNENIRLATDLTYKEINSYLEKLYNLLTTKKQKRLQKLKKLL